MSVRDNATATEGYFETISQLFYFVRWFTEVFKLHNYCENAFLQIFVQLYRYTYNVFMFDKTFPGKLEASGGFFS